MTSVSIKMYSCLINILNNDRQYYSTELANLFETRNVQLEFELRLFQKYFTTKFVILTI
jgi:hypothetical protein